MLEQLKPIYRYNFQDEIFCIIGIFSNLFYVLCDESGGKYLIDSKQM